MARNDAALGTAAGAAEGVVLEVEVAIVGAGISGIGAAIDLLERNRKSFVLLERGTDMGGTWRDNTYPGVAVDIPFASYCFSYETEFPWSRVFAPGHEIQAYIRHCVGKYGVAPYIRYQSQVVRARFDEGGDRWLTELADGTIVSSRYLIAATGLFTFPKRPDIPGLETFAGKVMHSAQWDHGYAFAGKRTAVIGTGASAVQIIPELAGRTAHLTVFQRTPIWISPRPDFPLAPFIRRFGPVRATLRFLSELGLEVLTFAIANYRRLPVLVRTVQGAIGQFMRKQIRDPALESRLLPDYSLGCKRPTPSNTYLGTFARHDVNLVTDAIDRIVPEGVRTCDGALHAVDALVLATGFLTTERGTGPAFEVFGRGGAELGHFWEDHRRQAYQGVSVPGYPNFFLIGGPFAGGFNWFAMLEANLDHIMRCLEEAGKRGVTRVEVRQDAHDRFMSYIWRRAEGTIFKDSSCATARSYYLDRHGDPSLPLPQTPWWRVFHGAAAGTRAYRFG
ncbi:MAG: NAD(P)/FAD-dependent oxidoreductase [Candidatus Sericytochromatia bacterium]|uniref:NAD(P)/FAD-dependent oxidoreductase n=1 Tax=Candidatus Tanganyikabacteria bacterium TaxID=2961651 RepID=A0A937X5I3_9BACT|nr:NAD(P)/FAD-dependent oxidoreductase [Candidatus Tanganyikabacteria bacterium]